MERIRGITSAEECQRKCRDDSHCEHFMFGVSRYQGDKVILFLLYAIKNNEKPLKKRKQKRKRIARPKPKKKSVAKKSKSAVSTKQCLLLRTELVSSSSWISGDKSCSTKPSPAASTSKPIGIKICLNFIVLFCLYINIA